MMHLKQLVDSRSDPQSIYELHLRIMHLPHLSSPYACASDDADTPNVAAASTTHIIFFI
jgi:hypothetical protein